MRLASVAQLTPELQQPRPQAPHCQTALAPTRRRRESLVQPSVRRARCWTSNATAQGAAVTEQPESEGSLPPTVSSNGSITQLISEVLNQQQDDGTPAQTDLLDTLDRLGGGVTTRVTRSWEARDAWLEIAGTWSGGDEARRSAMLCVYHERVWLRNQQLARMFQLLVRHRPGTVPPETVERVSAAIKQNTMCGATEALTLQELLLLGVSYLDNEDVLGAVSQAGHLARPELMKQPWIARDPARVAGLDVQLASLASAWRYQASLGVVRLHHARGIAATALALDKLRAQRNKQTVVAGSLWLSMDDASPSGSPASGAMGMSMDGGAGGSGSGNGTAAASSVWAAQLREVDFVVGQVAAFDKPGVTGPMCGRMGQVSFGRGGQPQPAATAGTAAGAGAGDAGAGTHTGLARGALRRAGGAGGCAGFGGDVVHELRAVSRALGDLEAARRATAGTFSYGAAMTFEKNLRRLLLDLLCGWASRHPEVVAVAPLQPHCTHSTNIRSSSREHVSRRVMVRVEGRELSWMRDVAKRRGGSFLDGWAPYVGSPYRGKEEWDYISEAPPVWHRFMSLPTDNINHTKLTLFWRKPPPTTTPNQPPITPTPTASASAFLNPTPTSPTPTPPTSPTTTQDTLDPTLCEQVSINLPLNALQQFMTVLICSVPAATSLSAGRAQAAGGSGREGNTGPAGGAGSSTSAWQGGEGTSSGRQGVWVGPPEMQLRYSPPAGAPLDRRPFPAVRFPSPLDGGGGYNNNNIIIVWSGDDRRRYRTAATPAVPYRPVTLHSRAVTGQHSRRCQWAAAGAAAGPAAAAGARCLPAGGGGSGAAQGGWGGTVTKLALRAVAVAALALSVPVALSVRLVGWSTHPLSSFARNGPATATAATPAAATSATATASSTPASTSASTPATATSPPAATSAAPLPASATLLASAPGTDAAQPELATAAAAAAAAAGPAAGWQPAGASLGEETLSRLCETVRRKVENRLWLPLTPLPAGRRAHQAVKAGADKAQPLRPQYVQMQLQYQVVVSSAGEVLGCMPLDPTSASWYPHLPLASLTRGKDVQAKQDRYLSTCLPNADKPQLPGTFRGLGSHAHYKPLPVTLVPSSSSSPSPASSAAAASVPTSAPASSSSSAAAAAAPVADVAVLFLRLTQLPDVKETFANRPNVEVALMQASVTPWSDMDSLQTWASNRSDIKVPTTLTTQSTTPLDPNDPQQQATHDSWAPNQAALDSWDAAGGELEDDADDSPLAAGMSQFEGMLQNLLSQLSHALSKEASKGQEGVTSKGQEGVVEGQGRSCQEVVGWLGQQGPVQPQPHRRWGRHPKGLDWVGDAVRATNRSESPLE